uniref:Mitochondrial pyruvate carrier n=1 Tax=Rhodosorus marinus TaxID=101924 RepID=A0A7S3ACP3_9RHOD
MRAFLDRPAGPKTIFFWAPMMKWGLVVAGLADLNRPVEKISVPQSMALACTGLIWVRYSFVIIPKNYNLALVNFFVGGTGMYQLSRVFKARMEASRSLNAVRE